MGYPMSRRALQLTLFYLMCTLWYPSLLTWLYKYSSEIAISSVRATGRVTVLLLSNLGTFVIGYVSYVSCMYFACILHVS
jgi:hypothetical protein